jgi:hypothetical protein
MGSKLFLKIFKIVTNILKIKKIKIKNAENLKNRP